MKAKVERGSGFRGVLNYGLGKGGNACEIIGGNMSSTDPQALAAEFALSRQARPGVSRPVWHTSLTLPKEETLDSDKWSEIVADFMKGMGLADHQHVVIRHYDTDYDHVHIVASRISLDGGVWHGKFDAKQAIELTQEIEKRHGLIQTKGLDDGPAPERGPTRQEIEQMIRTDNAPPRLVLQQIVDAALSEPCSVFDFMDRIEAAGAVARPNVARTGKMNGFSFEYAGIHFKGSDLGKSYTWKGLCGRGVEYEQDRDGEALRERAVGFNARESEIDSRGSDAADIALGSAGRGSGETDGRLQNGSTGHGRDDEGSIGSYAGSDKSGPGECARGTEPVSEEDSGGGKSSTIDRKGLGIGLEARSSSFKYGGFNGEAAADRRNAPERAEGDSFGIEKGRSGGAEHEGSDRSTAVDAYRYSGSVRPSDWNGVFNRTADLAAGAYPEDLADVSGAQVTPAISAKRSAWDQQHAALQAPAYRLTLMSRVEGLGSFNIGKDRGPDGSEKFYTADEVRNLIPYLSAQNARGRDIYLTPIDQDYHHIVVDDTTEASLGDLIAAGYRPALVQESSAGNRQAVLKVPKGRDRDEQKAANEVVVSINRRFGDEKFSGVIHPFRMAGFSNKKPGRNNAFTRIVEAVGGICTRALEQLDMIRARIIGERSTTPKSRAPRTGAIDAETLSAASTEAESAFDRARRQAEGLALHMGWQRDESRLDYRAAQSMAEDGWSREQIAAAIVARSPNLVDRHKNPLDYAARTAENVTIIEVVEAPQGEQTPTASDGPEGP